VDTLLVQLKETLESRPLTETRKRQLNKTRVSSNNNKSSTMASSVVANDSEEDDKHDGKKQPQFNIPLVSFDELPSWHETSPEVLICRVRPHRYKTR